MPVLGRAVPVSSRVRLDVTGGNGGQRVGEKPTAGTHVCGVVKDAAIGLQDGFQDTCFIISTQYSAVFRLVRSK